jgi:hypothetical protein
MFEQKDRLVALFVFVFFFHGIAYYFFPEQHYLAGEGSSGWIAYIKYICVFLSLPLLIKYRIKPQTVIWLSIGIVFVSAPFALQLYWLNELNPLIAQYQMPILGYFFAGYSLKLFSSSRRTEYLILFTLLVSFASMAAEIMLGDFFRAYSRSGLRSAGLFINPNNTGIFISIATSAYLFISKNSIRYLAATLLGFSIIAMSGSKTAVVLLLVGVLFSKQSWPKFAAILLTSLTAFIYSKDILQIWQLLELREISTESGAIRGSDADSVIRMFSDASATGLLFGISRESLVDNAYIDMLSYGGISLAVTFFVSQVMSIYMCARRRFLFGIYLHGLIFLSMLTTNTLRLWPVAYIYWALVGVSVVKWLDRPRFTVNSTLNSPMRIDHV